MRTFILLLVFVLFTTAVPAQDRPPRLSETDDARLFLRRAEAYLQGNPRSRHAAAVTMDLHVLAVALKNPGMAENMKIRLICSYPRSPYAHFLVAQHGSADEYSKFLKKLVNAKPSDVITKLRGIWVAIRLGREKFGDDVMRDDTVALVAALAAHREGKKDSAEKLLTRTSVKLMHRGKGKRPLRKNDEKTMLVMEAGYTPGLSGTKRIERLHAIRPSQLARIYQTSFTMHLPKTEWETPAVQTTIIENLLHAKESTRALIRINEQEALATDPRLLYWKAYCLSDSGKHAEELKILETVVKEFPTSKWAKPAALLARSLKTRDSALEAHGTMLLRVADGLRSVFDKVEMTVHVSGDGNKEATNAYVGIDAADEQINIQLTRGKEPLVLFRTDDKGMRILLKGDKAILKTGKESRLIPTPMLNIVRYPNGGFGLSMNMNIGSDISVLEKAKKQFLSSKYVTTKEGIATMLARTARTKVPLPPSKTADGGTEYTWLVSRPVEGNLEQFTMAVDKEGKLTSILTPTIKVSPIRYGKQLKLNPPSWPDMPEEDVEKMDPTRFMAMFAQVLKLFTD